MYFLDLTDTFALDQERARLREAFEALDLLGYEGAARARREAALRRQAEALDRASYLRSN